MGQQIVLGSGVTSVSASGALTGTGAGGSPLAVAVDGATMTITGDQLVATGTFGAESVSATAFLVGATAGIDTSITTAGLVGKTITVSKGIITGFA